MSVLPSLPTIRAYLAFNPTDIYAPASSQTWTEITDYLISYTTVEGRQHALDRVESSTCQPRFNGRDGFFTNATTNGTGHTVSSRHPFKIEATYSAVTYPMYYGVIDSFDLAALSRMNVEYAPQASDLLSLLAQEELSNPDLYGDYVNGTSAVGWFRFNSTPGSQTLTDQLGNMEGSMSGALSLNQQGVELYDTKFCADLTGGTNNATGYVSAFFIGIPSPAPTAMDFWIIGQGLANSYLIYLLSGFGQTLSLSIDGSGRVVSDAGHVGSSVNDGLWHHIAISAADTVNPATLWVDGVAFTHGSVAAGVDTLTGMGTYLYSLGQSIITGNPSLPGYVDEWVIATAASVATYTGEVVNRYRAGSLLRNVQTSGDRVAEYLTVVGFGTISGGVPVLSNFWIDGAAFVYGTMDNGTELVQGLVSPVSTNFCLDEILHVCDTEFGTCSQRRDGDLQFFTRAWPYRAAGNVTPSGKYLWADDAAVSTYHFEASDLKIPRDVLDVWPKVSITPVNGLEQVIVSADDVGQRWGWQTLRKSATLHVTNEQANAFGQYLALVFGSMLTRVAGVVLRSEILNGANLDALIEVLPQDQVRLSYTAPGSDASGTVLTNYLVESIEQDFASDPGYLHVKFVLDPYPVRFAAQGSPTYFLILDDATYGKLDLNNVL